MSLGEADVLSLIVASVWFAVFAVLFVTTVLVNTHHFRVPDLRRKRLVRMLDTMCLLPNWGFFAPNPGVYSYSVLLREVYATEGVSQWRHVPVAPARNQPLQFIWNPHGRMHKALLDVCGELIECSNELRACSETERELLIKLTIPYIKCLDLVCRAPLFPGAQYVQFAVVQLYQDEPPRLLLLSGRHRV